MKLRYYILCFFMCFNLFAQELDSRYVLSGGVAHIGNGEIIENSTIIIDKGKIVAIGPSSSVIINKKRAKVYDVTGKNIYPSLILPNTTLGLVEIDAVRASRDYKEIGGVNPNIRSLIAYNTDSKLAKTVRSNGVLIAQVTPRGGLISGQSSIMHLDGNNWEDAVIKSDDGIHLNWPNSYNSTGWWAEPGETKENKEYQTKIYELEDLFSRANSTSPI